MKNLDERLLLNGRWDYLEDRNGQLTYQELRVSLKKTKKIELPVNWELAGLHNYSGTVWFLKTFKYPAPGELEILMFNGVDYFADVWLNDKYLGNHEGYFQSFNFDVTSALKKGENLLVVKVNSPLEEPGTVWPYRKKLIKGIFNHHDCRPGAWSEQYGQDQNTGGIWNDITLYSVNKVFTENPRISSKIDSVRNLAAVNVSIPFYRKSDEKHKEKIEITVIPKEGRKLKFKEEVLFEGEKGELKFTIEIDKPDLWWCWELGEPNLYRMNISCELFNIKNVIFGIREVHLNSKEEFFLNGKRLFLRGTNVIPTQFLSELDEQRIKDQVSLIKDANINIIRMHAHVNRTEYYDECDRQGILVWQDFALQWTYDESAQFFANAAAQIKDMVKLHFNHPSIAFWCCHNEPGNQIKTLDHLLYEAVETNDNSRIIRMASNYEEHPYDGWYWGSKEHFAAKPMGPLVTEFGAQALTELKSLKKIIPRKDLDNPGAESWAYHDFQYEQTFNVAEVERGKNIKQFIDNSQDYQADLLKTAIDFYRRGKNKDITGIFQFMFIDCWPSITWSVVDYFGVKKKGYFTVQKAFQPLYISVNIRQKKYFAGQKLKIDYWIINDYQKTFSSCRLIISLGDEITYNIPVKDISKDSASFSYWEDNDILLPEKIKTGKYNLVFRLKQEGEVLSENNYEIEIVKKI